MREFHFIIEEALQKGLRPSDRMAPGAPYMVTMQNLKPSPYGAKSIDDIAEPITTPALTVDWPFPQVFKGHTVTIIAAETAIYSVSGTTGTLLTTYDFSNWSNTKTITAGGGAWHFAEFWGTWILWNEANTVFKTGASSKVFVQNTVTINTGCNWKNGRAVFGGFDSTDFWLSAWTTFWNNQMGNAVPKDVSDYVSTTSGAGQNWVWWSTVGGGDLWWLFSQDLMTYGSIGGDNDLGYGPDNPWIFEMLNRNQCGMAPMPWSGKVHRTLPIHDHVIVYGDNGISMLRSQDGIVGVYPVLGVPEGVGILSRGAVAGDDRMHVFIDQEGYLWRIETTEYGIVGKQMGHKEYFDSSSTADISLDPKIGDYWIVLDDGTDCYLYNQYGLGGPNQVAPTSLIRDDDADLLGYTLDIDDRDLAIAKTAPFDFGESGTKHISTLQIFSDSLTKRRTSVDADGVTFREAPVNANGASFPRASFKTGAVSVSGAYTKSETELHSIEVRYMSEDKRFRRGTKGVVSSGETE